MNPKVNSIANKIKQLIELEKPKSRPFKPVIISDIDGVLVRGTVPIPQTQQAMVKIHDLKIPFACLTNGGGRTESVKAESLNKCFKRKLFDGDSMFLNHTPLKPQIIRYSKLDGNLLLSGSLNIASIMQQLKISNYITADEIYSIYFQDHAKKEPERDLFHFHRNHLEKEEAEERIHRRIGRKLNKFEDQAKLISSIFALNDVSPYETTLTVIHNILRQNRKRDKTLPYYAAQNDVIWAGGYFRPRIAFGPFNYLLDEHCKRHNFQLIEHIYYGKPSLKAFQFVEHEMRKRQPNGVFFMMGDNPKADIRGANTAGWYSFLTQTGIHPSSQNDPNDPATFVVSNFHEAVQIITGASQSLPQ